MFKRLLPALALCAGLVVAPEPAPAASFGLAVAVPQALDAPVTEVRGGRHWRRFWRRYRRRHHMHRHRHHRRWHRYHRHGIHRHAGRAHGRLRFQVERGASRTGRDAAPVPAPKASSPKLY